MSRFRLLSYRYCTYTRVQEPRIVHGLGAEDGVVSEVLDNQEMATHELGRKVQTTGRAWLRNTPPTEVLNHPDGVDRLLDGGIACSLNTLPKDSASALPPRQLRPFDMSAGFELNFALCYEVQRQKIIEIGAGVKQCSASCENLASVAGRTREFD